MRVLVCGGRDYNDGAKVKKTLDDFCDMRGLVDDEYNMPLGVTVIHGGATGADRWADEWAVTNWLPIKEYKADWKAHGKAAGPIRNQQMLDDGKPDVVIAFSGGKGTADMISRAEKAGLPIIRIL